MRIIVTGQVGLDKKPYLNEVAALAAAREGGGGSAGLHIYHIGDMMYREAPDVPPGRILDLPLARLNSLRRAVMRDVISDMHRHRHVLINTHATFRWKHGLFSAFDFDQLAAFSADLYITMVDNIESIHQRMVRDHELEHSLKDLMVWREEEILATEICARAHVLSQSPDAIANGTQAPAPKFFVLSRGRKTSTAETLYRLIFRPGMKKVYPSFPMTHVVDQPDVLAEVDAFRAAMAEKFITFDPGDVDEKILADQASIAARHGQLFIEIPALPTPGPGSGLDVAAAALPPAYKLAVREVLDIAGDIDGQIYARDFILVRQSDMIVSYIPELPNGKPGLSSGVERELQHAHEHGKNVFVIWKPKKDPSPFVTQTANKVFPSVAEALKYFDQKGFFSQHDLFGS